MTISHLSTSRLGNELIFIESVYSLTHHVTFLDYQLQPRTLCYAPSSQNQIRKKKKDHESLVSDWLSLMGKKEKGWKIRPCVSSCPFLLQDGWKHDVWSVLGLDNSEPETGMGWAWKTEPGAKEKGHLRGKQADCPVTIWESLGTKQWKKKPDKNWK